jgi:flagella basal body P-ring formation protein FlgA
LTNIESKDRSIVRELTNLKIGKSPRVGYLDRVNWQTIRSQIERAIPGLYSRIEFSGAKVVAVETVGSILDALTYIDPAREELRTWLKHRYDEYDIKVRGRYKNLQLPRGNIEIRTRLGEAVNVNDNMNVWVDVLVDKNHYQTISVGFSVKAFAPVWVAVKSMKNGNIIQKESLRKEYKDIAKLNDAPVDEVLPTNERLKENVSEGEVIVASNLENIPDVSKGEKISVVAQEGAVTVTAVAIALDDGNMGDKIRVGKPNSDIVYHAVVMGRKLATINGE